MLLSSRRMPASPPLSIAWAIHDGRAGNRRQVLALASALRLDAVEQVLDPGPSARWLAPRQLPWSSTPFGVLFEQALHARPPQLALGCGRMAALATRLARRAGARAVQILDPRTDTRHWDLVIAPDHDRLRGNNVLPLVGSLNPVDADWLIAARQEFDTLEQRASPRTAVLIGGPTTATRFDHAALQTMLGKLDASVAQDGGSLLICASARTPKAWTPMLRERYCDARHLLWLDASDGPNPYAGVLAWADRIVATPDSVNMISEACSTTVPVHVAELHCASGRIAAFLQSLITLGRIQPYAGALAPFAVTALTETSRIAALVRERLSLR